MVKIMISRNEKLVQERQFAIAWVNLYIILWARGQRDGLYSSKSKLKMAYTNVLLRHDYKILKIFCLVSKWIWIDVIILFEQILTPVAIMNFLKHANQDFTEQSIISSERRVFETIQFKVKLKIHINKSMYKYIKKESVVKFQWWLIWWFRSSHKFPRRSKICQQPQYL